MTVELKREQEQLIVTVKERLDTTTAPDLEKILQGKLEGVRELIFDFFGLDYISSAGLRVLLAAHKIVKKQHGKTIIKGANQEVREVFVITGFSEMMSLE